MKCKPDPIANAVVCMKGASLCMDDQGVEFILHQWLLHISMIHFLSRVSIRTHAII